MTAVGVVRALAPAKINPTLLVLGRRDDGYHELATTMVALELADRLEVEASEAQGVALSVSGPAASGDVPRGRENLAVRAAEAVLAAARARGLLTAGRARGLSIRLEKRIPSQSGLGGASSDAAAAVLASERALGFELPAGERQALLAALGSDCAFFAVAAATGAALCTGRGERVEPLPAPWPGACVAILTPDVRCPTADVYRAVGATLSRARELPTVASAALGAPVERSRELFRNDLEAVALRAIPGLAAWRAALDASGAGHFRLSGSGSSFFGVFASRPLAEEALARVGAELAARSLPPRGAWITQPSGRGAQVFSETSPRLVP